MEVCFYDTVIGQIGIAAKNGCVTNLFFETDDVPNDLILLETDVIREAFRQLAGYFSGNLKEFSLPLAPCGTDFMFKVWELIRGVPYGSTASYKDIATSAGNPNAVRAVGMANNKNPIPLFIPCHRIIGTNGNLIGYRGGLEIKKKLLELERYHASF